MLKYHRKSEQRVDPFCLHFDLCGGCKWQHLPYEMQLEFKQQQVIDQLQRIGKTGEFKLLPILGSDKSTRYRNKLEYTFTNNRWLTPEEIASNENIDRNGVGFHLPGRFDRLLDINKCHLQPEPTNEVREFIKQLALQKGLSFYNVREHEGLLRNLIVRTTEHDDLMVIIQFGEDDADGIEVVMSHVRDTFPEITSLNYVVNLKQNETFHDLEVVNYAGKPHITESIEGIRFKIGPKSFFQTNTLQAVNLYNAAIKLAELKASDIAYDLYCGTGTIANLVASRVQKVVGIEYVPEAIEDARYNAAENGIENAVFEAGDIKELLTPAYFEKHGQPDVILIDPPRAGMHADVTRAVNESGAERIVYVSCNPATQARDLQQLVDYTLQCAQPVDMFPHTHHVENIVLLERNQ